MFTRLSDDEQLFPVMVFGPLEYERESRTVVRELLESSTALVTFFPGARRAGVFNALFSSHADAKDAIEFFAQTSAYLFEPDLPTGGSYAWVDGYYVFVPVGVDTSHDVRFVVTGDSLTIAQNDEATGMWELAIPYKEVPA